MAEKDSGDSEGVEVPEQGGELLSLLMRFGYMKESAAAMRLDVDISTLRVWEWDLVAGGWLKPPDYSLSDPILDLSGDYAKKISGVTESLLKSNLVDEATKKPVNSKKKKKLSFKVPLARFNTVFIYDMIVLVSIGLSLHLLKEFFINPDLGSVGLFAGAVLLFLAVLVKRSYSRFTVAKARENKLSILLSVLKEIIIGRKKYIVFFILFFMIMFFVGRFYVSSESINLLLLILPLSSIPLLFLRKRKTGFLIRYYAEMLLLMYSFLLLSGLYSVSERLLYMRIWVLDFLTAFTILFLLKWSEKRFGVAITFVFDLLKFEKLKTE